MGGPGGAPPKLRPHHSLFSASERREIHKSLILWFYLWVNELFLPEWPYSESNYQFLMFFKWFYSSECNFVIEASLNKCLQMEPVREKFKSSFFKLQDRYDFLFLSTYRIGDHTMPLRSLLPLRGPIFSKPYSLNYGKLQPFLLVIKFGGGPLRGPPHKFR